MINIFQGQLIPIFNIFNQHKKTYKNVGKYVV